MRALVLILALAIGPGCSVLPGPDGRAVLVGDVAYATAPEGGECEIQSANRDSDYGTTPEDFGKHKHRSRAVRGGEVCYAGSGITDNLRALGAFVLGLVL